MIAKGLEGIVVEETSISDVRAEGVLTYRGENIEALTETPFADVAEWVITGEMTGRFEPLLATLASLDAQEAAIVTGLPRSLHPMKVLQAVVPALSKSPELGFGEADQGIYAAAKLPAVVATHLTGHQHEMDESLPYADRFLHAISDEAFSQDLVGAFNATQILQIEHSMNAGTFASRVVASTLATIESAIAAGIGALSGPLHGGADEAVLNLADRMESPEAARDHVAELLRSGGKIPGMGHREYRAKDPRAICLEAWVGSLVEGTVHQRSFDVLKAMELEFRDHMAELGKDLHANVEFYKGLIYRMIGLPNHFFTCGFAMARTFGYVAHFIESRRDNRIYRPAARYVA